VEKITSGEIFCVVARQSSEYRLVPLAWACRIALLLPAPLIYFTLWPAALIYLIQLVAFIVIALVLWQAGHPLPMSLPRWAKHARAHTLAMRQFFSQGLTHTENRTGVLIFAPSPSAMPRSWRTKHQREGQLRGVGESGGRADRRDQGGASGDGFVAAVEQCAWYVGAFSARRAQSHELPNRSLVI